MKRLVFALVGLAVVVSACGDDTGSTRTTTPPPTTTTSTADAGAGQAVPLLATTGVARSVPNIDAPVGQLVAGLNQAGFDLWGTQSIDANFVFSPMSIGHALLMARGAADPATGAAIDAALGLPDGTAAHEAWNAAEQLLAGDAAAEDEITVTMADRIWPRLDVSPDQDWIDLLVANHGVSLEALDYGGDTAGSREIINSWVGDKTEQLIPELLPAGFLTSDTVLVLTDAAYFEARWLKVFGKTGPIEGSFTRLDGSTVEMEFMQELELLAPRGSGDGFVAAEVPYVGSDFSMLLIIPDEANFQDMRMRLGQDLLDEIDLTMAEGAFELVMPQWSTTTAIDLLDWLTEIGAAPGLYPGISPDAFLGAAVHGADIEVDEVGTVAAAATAIGFLESGSPQPAFVVRADQPFLYLIRHRPTGLVLFAGQVTDPTS